MGNVDIGAMILRTTGAFLALLVMTRIMGKKQLSHLTFFNYITGITIGNIAADISSQSERPFWNGMTSLIWWGLLTLFVSAISLKFAHARVVLDGQPTIVIKKGVILEQALSRLRLNLDDLSMLLREQGIFSVREVDYAILEPHGKLSVLKKQEHLMPARGELKLPLKPSFYLPSELIVDGLVVTRNLAELGLDGEWLKNELSGLDPRQVFYAELQADGTLYYQKKEKKKP